MQLELSSAQLNNLRKGKAVNYKGGPTRGKAHVIEVDDSTASRLHYGARRGKAVQIRGGNILGLPSKRVRGGAIQDYAEMGKNLLIDSGLAGMAIDYGLSKTKGNKKGKKVAKSASDGLLAGLKSYDLSDTNNMTKNAKTSALTGALSAYQSYKGKGFLDDLKNTGKSLKKGLTKAGDKIKKGANKTNKALLKADLGGKIESIKQHIPPELIQLGAQIAMTSQGVDPDAAQAISATGTTALYSYDFGEKADKSNFSNAGMNALNAGLQSGMVYGQKQAMKASTPTASVEGGRLSHKGTGNHVREFVKGVRFPHSGAGMSIPKTLPNRVVLDANPTAKSIGQVRFDPNLQFEPKKLVKSVGGSFRSTSGGSFRPTSGGSFRPTSGDGMPSRRGKMVKGSAEAKEWAQKMREARDAKRR